MKTLSKLMMMGVAGLLLWSCETNDANTVVNPGAVSITATATQTTLVLDSTGAKTTTATVISWNAAKYGAPLSVIYSVEIDSASGTFAKPTAVLLGNNVLTLSYTVKAINDLALSLKLKPAVAGALKFRVKSDVGSTDVPPIYSPVITINITPYSEELPPLYPVPQAVFLVGGATPGGWSNPVTTPSQQMTQIDYKSFGIIIQMTAGGDGYDFLPVNGSWTTKYNVASSSANSLGDAFAPRSGGSDIPPPPTSGVYMIILDFVKGTYALTPYSAPAPNNVYITGGATAGGWQVGGGQGVPLPSQQFTRLTNSEYTITLPLTCCGDGYLFLPLNGDWGHKYATTNGTATGGPFTYDGPNNFPPPAATGTYTIDVNFLSGLYKVSQ